MINLWGICGYWTTFDRYAYLFHLLIHQIQINPLVAQKEHVHFSPTLPWWRHDWPEWRFYDVPGPACRYHHSNGPDDVIPSGRQDCADSTGSQSAGGLEDQEGDHVTSDAAKTKSKRKSPPITRLWRRASALSKATWWRLKAWFQMQAQRKPTLYDWGVIQFKSIFVHVR